MSTESGSRVRIDRALMVMGISLIALVLSLALSFPVGALASDGVAAEPYTRVQLWMGAVAYVVVVLLAVVIAFRGRFSRRQGGTTVHDDLWRKYEERKEGSTDEVDR